MPLQWGFHDVYVISQDNDVNQPRKIIQSNLSGFFLWCFVKVKVYPNNLLTINGLRQNIHRVINE